jgi:hypothetical protein
MPLRDQAMGWMTKVPCFVSWNFFCLHNVQTGCGPSQISVQWVQGLSGWVVDPTTHLFLVTRLRMVEPLLHSSKQKQNKLHGLSPRANYTDRATAACRRSYCQLLRIKGATWSA